MKKLQNCWEVMKCGFGQNRRKTKAHKICPAAQENRLDGVHRGLQGGRVCWFVDNTFDSGKGAQRDFSNKFPICMNCKFYWQVKDEEESQFEVSILLNTYLHNK